MAHAEHGSGHGAGEAAHTAAAHVEATHEVAHDAAHEAHDTHAPVASRPSENADLMQQLLAERRKQQDRIDEARRQAEVAAAHTRASVDAHKDNAEAGKRRKIARLKKQEFKVEDHKQIEHALSSSGEREVRVAAIAFDQGETAIPLQLLFGDVGIKMVHDTKTFYDKDKKVLHLDQSTALEKEPNLTRIAIELAIANAISIPDDQLGDEKHQSDPSLQTKHVEALRAYAHARDHLRDTKTLLRASPDLPYDILKERYLHAEHEYAHTWKNAQRALLEILRARSAELEDLTAGEVQDGYSLAAFLGAPKHETTDELTRKYFRAEENILTRPYEFEDGEFISEATGEIVEPDSLSQRLKWWWGTTDLAQEPKIWQALGKESIPASRKTLWAAKATWGTALVSLGIAGWTIKQSFRAFGFVGRLPYRLLTAILGHPKIKSEVPAAGKLLQAGAGWMFEKKEDGHDAHGQGNKKKARPAATRH